MLNKTIKLWSKYNFEISFFFTIILFALLSIWHLLTGKKGTYMPYKYYNYFSRPSNNTNIHYKTSSKSNDSKGETECRRVLQQIFNKPFNKERPSFLSNPVTGSKHNLELDCYCEELKLALEYDGQGHHKYTPYFHKSKEVFYNQQYRDYMKDIKCKENGITLIRVPYTIKIPYIEQYILNKLSETGFL